MQFSPKLFIVVAGVALVATAVAVDSFLRQPPPAAAGPHLSLEKMGQLVSMKVKYAEIVELNQQNIAAVMGVKLFKFGSAKVLFVAKGDCIIGSDLTAARTRRLPASPAAGVAHTVELTLLLPRPLEYSVNHAPKEQGGSYLVVADASLLVDQQSRNRAIDHAMTAAQDDVKRACSQPAMIESARQNAETVLTSLFVANGEHPIFHWL